MKRKHHFHLLATDVETGESMDYATLGSEPKRVRLNFASACFGTQEAHDHALHRKASDHVLNLHHNYGIAPENMVASEHDGQAAYVVTVRRSGFSLR
jgi:hypothetical protein